MSQKITCFSLLACSLAYSAPDAILGSQQLGILPERAAAQRVAQENFHDGKDIVFYHVRFRAYPLNKRRNNLFGTASTNLLQCEGCRDTNPLNPHLSCPVPYMHYGESRAADTVGYVAADDVSPGVKDPVIGIKGAKLDDTVDVAEEEVLDISAVLPIPSLLPPTPPLVPEKEIEEEQFEAEVEEKEADKISNLGEEIVHVCNTAALGKERGEEAAESMEETVNEQEEESKMETKLDAEDDITNGDLKDVEFPEENEVPVEGGEQLTDAADRASNAKYVEESSELHNEGVGLGVAKVVEGLEVGSPILVVPASSSDSARGQQGEEQEWDGSEMAWQQGLNGEIDEEDHVEEAQEEKQEEGPELSHNDGMGESRDHGKDDCVPTVTPSPDSVTASDASSLFWLTLGGITLTLLLLGLGWKTLVPLLLMRLYCSIEAAYHRGDFAGVVRWASLALPLTQRLRGEGGETLSLRHYLARALLSLPPPVALERIHAYLGYIQRVYEEGVGVGMSVLLKGAMMGAVYEDLGLVNSLQGHYEKALNMFALSLQLYIEECEMKEGGKMDFLGSDETSVGEAKDMYSESKLYSRLNSSLYSPPHIQDQKRNGAINDDVNHYAAYPASSPISTSLSPLSPDSPLEVEVDEEGGGEGVRRSLESAFWKETSSGKKGGDLFKTLEELESLLDCPPSPPPSSPPRTPPSSHPSTHFHHHSHPPHKLYMSGDVARLCMRIGGVLVRLGRGAEGVGYIQRALDICMLIGGESGEVKVLRDMLKSARELEEKERRARGEEIKGLGGDGVKVPSPISVAHLDILEQVFR